MCVSVGGLIIDCATVTFGVTIRRFARLKTNDAVQSVISLCSSNCCWRVLFRAFCTPLCRHCVHHRHANRVTQRHRVGACAQATKKSISQRIGRRRLQQVSSHVCALRCFAPLCLQAWKVNGNATFGSVAGQLPIYLTQALSKGYESGTAFWPGQVRLIERRLHAPAFLHVRACFMAA